MDRLVWSQDSPDSMRVARGLSGFICSHCRGRGLHLELSPEPQGYSPVLTWISGFLWSFHRGVGLVSCGDMQDCSPLELEKQSQPSSYVDLGICGFLSRCHKAVTRAIVFESILVVTVESGRGILCTCRGLGHPGMLEWWNDHWSSFSLSI